MRLSNTPLVTRYARYGYWAEWMRCEVERCTEHNKPILEFVRSTSPTMNLLVHQGEIWHVEAEIAEFIPEDLDPTTPISPCRND